jgi:hypothetical protein
MSTLVAQTISNGTVSTSSENVIQGSAKAWVNVSNTTINSSYNVSSVTHSTTGRTQINFTNALASTCSPIAMAAPTSDVVIFCYTALQSSYGTNGSSAVFVSTVNQSTVLVTPANLYVSVFSS